MFPLSIRVQLEPKSRGEDRVPKRSTCVSSSFADHALHFGVDEGKAGERRRVHGIDEVLVRVGEPRLLAQELPVKVAAVAGGFLWVRDFSLGECLLRQISILDSSNHISGPSIV